MRRLCVALACVLAVVLTACDSTVSGRGAEVSARPTVTTTTSVPAPASTATASGSVAPAPSYRTVVVTGTAGGSYTAHVYASDTVKDCAAHAYGATMIAFLRKHACFDAHRVLFTIELGGRLAVFSSIATGFGSTGSNPYAVNEQFQKLENADGTGSLNDLLREGHQIPGIATEIPVHEVFKVLGQDNGTTVFDGWWATGSTSDTDATLTKVEQNLFLTPLTSG